MSPEDFARVLALLSPDTEEAGRLYARLHSKLTGFFTFKGISDPLSAADETIDRAILKIRAGTVIPDLEKYCLGIARNIAKERHRRAKREDRASHEFQAGIDDSPVEQIERISDILKPCFEQLPVEDQQLLSEYCRELQGRARAEHRRQLAEAMKLTLLALRIRVTRLRNKLSDCVQKRSKSFENAALLSNKNGISSILI